MLILLTLFQPLSSLHLLGKVFIFLHADEKL